MQSILLGQPTICPAHNNAGRKDKCVRLTRETIFFVGDINVCANSIVIRRSSLPAPVCRSLIVSVSRQVQSSGLFVFSSFVTQHVCTTTPPSFFTVKIQWAALCPSVNARGRMSQINYLSQIQLGFVSTLEKWWVWNKFLNLPL